MAQLIAFCGLDCDKCEAYIATQAKDVAAQQRVAEKWQKDFNLPNTTIADVTCDGCVTANGRLSGYCGTCPIRACGVTHGLENCGHCPDYAKCDKLADFFSHVPAARETLDALRRAL